MEMRLRTRGMRWKGAHPRDGREVGKKFGAPARRHRAGVPEGHCAQPPRSFPKLRNSN
jgi:hypothetical protein